MWRRMGAPTGTGRYARNSCRWLTARLAQRDEDWADSPTGFGDGAGIVDHSRTARTVIEVGPRAQNRHEHVKKICKAVQPDGLRVRNVLGRMQYRSLRGQA